MTVQHEGAREYLSNLFGVDCSGLSIEKVVAGIDSTYPGGWAEFAKGWGESPVDSLPRLEKTIKSEPTRFQMLSSAMKMTGQAIRIGLLDEVLEIKIRPDYIQIDLKVYKVTEQASRWKVTNQGLRRLKWEKRNEFWVRKHDEEIWVPEGVFEPRYIHNFGTIQTDEVWNERRDQFHLCYRPGTAKSPMQGPQARIEEHGYVYFDRYEREIYYGGDEADRPCQVCLIHP